MVVPGWSDGFSDVACGKLTSSSENFEYVVVIIKNIRITNNTSIIGIKLISGSSLFLPR
jgi:hypothetical protein